MTRKTVLTACFLMLGFLPALAQDPAATDAQMQAGVGFFARRSSAFSRLDCREGDVE